MKPRVYEYRFVENSAVTKLIVTVAHSVQVEVVAGNLALAATLDDKYYLNDDSVAVGGHVFAPDHVSCDLSVSGQHVRVRAKFVPETRYLRPLGVFCAWGWTEYNVQATVVTGIMEGTAEFGGTVFGARTVISCDYTRGFIFPYRRTVAFGAKDGNAFWLASGSNRTWLRPWKYGVAFLRSGGKNYAIGGATRLKAFEDSGTDFRWSILSPLLLLDVHLKISSECEARDGTRYITDGIAEIVLRGRDYDAPLVRTQLPAVITHRGKMRVKAGRAPESSRAAKETTTCTSHTQETN